MMTPRQRAEARERFNASNGIVKLQLSLDGGSTLLAYDEHKTFHLISPASDDVVALLKGRGRAFFYAKIAHDGTLEIGDEAPEQDW